MYRDDLVHLAADYDDDLMEKVLMEEEVSVDEIKAALRKGCIACGLTPVTVGASFKNKGVQPLLDAVVDYLPSPLDIPAMKGIDMKTDAEVERPADPKAPFAALAFKVMTDPYVGKLTYFRVYSGTLRSGSYVLNSGGPTDIMRASAKGNDLIIIQRAQKCGSKLSGASCDKDFHNADILTRKYIDAWEAMVYNRER